MNSLDVISEVARCNPSISYFRLLGFQIAPRLQDRLGPLSSEETQLVDAALALKRRSHLHFWEALLTVIAEVGGGTPRLLEGILLHQPNNNLFNVSSDRVTNFVNDRAGANVACNSLVMLDAGDYAHVPLLDFKVPISDTGMSLVIQCLRQLGLRGYVLNSGRSYHFWGLDLLSDHEMMHMLAQFVLLHPISDKSWAAHQLMERSASLRISSRNGKFPEVVADVL